MFDSKTPQPAEIMTTSEVAEFLHVHRSTLHRYREQGIITAYKFGKRVYYRRSEVLASIMANPIQVVSADAEDVKQAA